MVAPLGVLTPTRVINHSCLYQRVKYATLLCGYFMVLYELFYPYIFILHMSVNSNVKHTVLKEYMSTAYKFRTEPLPIYYNPIPSIFIFPHINMPPSTLFISRTSLLLPSFTLRSSETCHVAIALDKLL